VRSPGRPGGARRAATCLAGGLLGALSALDWAVGQLTWARALCWTALGLACFWVLLPPRVVAGEGWLEVRGPLRARRLRTDQLTAVHWFRGVSSYVVLRDLDGVRVELDPRVLTENPLLWHALESGARRARRQGTLRTGGDVLDALADRIDRDALRTVLKQAMP
jgi:hypothetical protein